MSWRDEAACVGADSESFAPVDFYTADAAEVVAAAALRYCTGCPVIVSCARFADGSRHTGLWGGGFRRVQQGRYEWAAVIPGAPEPVLTDRRSGVRGAAWAS